MRGRVVVLVVVVALLAVWTIAIPGWVQWQVGAALRRSIPADSVKVRIQGRPDAVLAGHLARLSVEIRRATVDGLPVEGFSATLSGVELETTGVLHTGPVTIRHIGGGQALLILTQEGLQRYLEQAKGMKGARVRLADGVMTLEGTIMVLQSEIQTTVRGRFVIQDGRQVLLQVQSFSISGVALPEGIGEVLIAPLNPLLTVDHLSLPLRLLTVTIDNGQLVLTAEPVS